MQERQGKRAPPVPPSLHRRPGRETHGQPAQLLSQPARARKHFASPRPMAMMACTVPRPNKIATPGVPSRQGSVISLAAVAPKRPLRDWSSAPPRCPVRNAGQWETHRAELSRWGAVRKRCTFVFRQPRKQRRGPGQPTSCHTPHTPQLSPPLAGGLRWASTHRSLPVVWVRFSACLVRRGVSA